MLELYKYSIKEIEYLKDFFLVTYVVIDDLYQEITPEYIKTRKNANYSILSDSEIITISIVSELLYIDSEMENGDLVLTDNEEELREDIKYQIEVYNWNVGYKQYIKIK